MNNFNQPNIESQNGSFPPPVDYNEIDFDAINKQVIAERQFGGAPKPVETYDFSNERGDPSVAEKKESQEARAARLATEKQIQALRQDIAGMN